MLPYQYRLNELKPTGTRARIFLQGQFVLLLALNIYTLFALDEFIQAVQLPMAAWYAFLATAFFTNALLGVFAFKSLPASRKDMQDARTAAEHDPFLTQQLERLTQGRSIARNEMRVMKTYIRHRQ